MTRVFSGMQPSGDPHLGNLLGAVALWVAEAEAAESLFCVVDLHSITFLQDPADLRRRTLELTATFLAMGLDADRSILFLQSQVPAHRELAWLLECTASYGELQRMTQFKDKSGRGEFVSAGLFTYPALMAADILAYDADEVPVGDDQRQHIELTRDLAVRFNARYGDTFVVPEGVYRTSGARIMDLQHPERKMSKSLDSPQGTVLLSDDDAVVARKIKRAVTDAETEVHYDPETKPGVSNLLSILAACTESTPQAAGAGFTRYGDLKAAVAEAVVEFLGPVRSRYDALLEDTGHLLGVLANGAARADAISQPIVRRAEDAMGFLPRAQR
ncbi:MAG TPA: tryptophan--tRNA ligase [Acidimicrobiales bacterium]|nr:tryptophan--tRNA ligase [Acidimicrobiales bacterium]